MSRVLGNVAVIIVMSVPALGQSASELLNFEVASIRVHREPPSKIAISTSGPRLRADAEMLLGLVLYAYDLKNYQLADSPALATVGETMYDIVAKADGDDARKPGEFRQMMQALLADRFKLKIHREMREMPVYALVLGKNGPKFKESDPDANFSGHYGVKSRNQTMTLSKATMEHVAQDLQLYVDRPVVDHTGLTGTYDIKFEATPAFRLNRNPDQPSEPGDISAFTAVQQQLGLRLEPRRAKIEVLVVDHVEKPSEN